MIVPVCIELSWTQSVRYNMGVSLRNVILATIFTPKSTTSAEVLMRQKKKNM